jgi:hypothetical protein
VISLRLALLTLPLVFLACPAQAQSLEARRDAKLREAWLQRLDWTTDYAEAQARASDQDKVILAYFTRSYSS